MEKYCRAGDTTDDNSTRPMRVSCWIPKATDAYLEYVILVALPLQQWLRERASIFLYTYIACLVLQQHRVSPASQLLRHTHLHHGLTE